MTSKHITKLDSVYRFMVGGVRGGRCGEKYSVGVKDIYYVDGWVTGAGTGTMEFTGEEGGLVAGVKKRRKYFLAGTTVSTEMQYLHPAVTVNPVDEKITPGGSSAGSAVAAKLGVFDITLGTQTNGSITRPAAYCNVYGMKPSIDRVNRDGIVNFSPTIDQVGYFSNDLAKIDEFSSDVVPNWRHCEGRAVSFILPSMRYLEKSMRDFSPYTAAYPTSPHLLSNIDEILHCHKILTEGEASRTLRHVLSHPKSNLLSQKFHDMMQRGSRVTDSDLATAQQSPAHLRAAIHEVLDAAKADVILAPSTVETSPPPRALSTTGDPTMCIPWSHAGVPTLSVPLPTGSVQLIARHGDDEALVPAAEALLASL